MSELSASEARKVLGVPRKPGPGEVRAAWRRLVMQYHPDREGGSEEKTREVNAAYEVLKALEVHARPVFETRRTEPEPAPETGPVDRRNRERAFSTKKKAFAETVVDTFKERLIREDQRRAYADAMQRNGGFYTDPRFCDVAKAAGADHVPDEIRISGNEVFFTVLTPMDAGQNRVALPTDPDGLRPAVVSFRTKQAGRGRVVLPSSERDVHFPWAERVEIEFRG